MMSLVACLSLEIKGEGLEVEAVLIFTSAYLPGIVNCSHRVAGKAKAFGKA